MGETTDEKPAAATAQAPMERYDVVTWWELPTTDLAASAGFLEHVFGWTTQPMGEDYLILCHGEEMIGGLFVVAPGAVVDGIRVSVNVRDLEATLARAEGGGGTVTRTREAIGEGFGWWAEVRDPCGLLLGVASMHPA